MQNSTVHKRLRKVMNICAIQLVIAVTMCSMALAHNNYAQVLDREVTLKLKDAKLKTVLSEIERSTDIRFVYSEQQISVNDRVTVNVTRKKLGDLLSELLAPRAIDYTADDTNGLVVLKQGVRKPKEKTSIYESSPADTPGTFETAYAAISGVVTDGSTNQPMPGVNIIVKGTTNGTSTDSDGSYTINAEDQDILVFSFIGFTSQEVQINGRSVIDIVMQEDAQRLNEIVVNAGYWEVKERESTGNISKVTAEVISKQPVANPLMALQGRMTGVTIKQNTGVPGGSFNIQIRGQNSLRFDGNDPLYIIDGVPFTSSTLTYGLSVVTNGGSPLSSINPSDIETIEVLKDADVTSVYGSRGANGVVLITTKKGKESGTSFTVDFYSGVSQVASTMNLLNTRQWLEMRNEAFKNDGALPGQESPDYDLLVWDTTRYTDWQKELIGGTANTLNTQLSLTGGNLNTKFLISGNYYSESSVFPGEFKYRKGSGHFSLSHSGFNNKLKMTFSTSYVLENNNQPREDLTVQAMTLSPNAPALYDEQGNLNWENGTWTNPIAAYTLCTYNSVTKNFVASSILSYELLKGLYARTNLGYTSMTLNDMQKTPIKSFDPGSGIMTGMTSMSNNSLNTWIVEPQLEYIKNLKSSTITFHIGSTFQQNVRENLRLTAYGFTNDELLEDLEAASSVNISSTNYTMYRYSAIFGRLNYNHKGRYIVNLTGRRDGSSRFGSGSQFANFGAIGMAWVFSNENFIQNNLSFLSFGKLSSSFGVTGSDQIGDYQYFDTYTPTFYNYQGISGLIPTRLVNPNYAWETNKKFSVALDFGFIQDRIHTIFNYYNNRSSNQLVGYSLPVITGNSTVQYNLPATVENKGWEFELNTINIKAGSFEWTSSVNLTIPRNKLIRYPNLEGSSYADTYVVGLPLSISKRFHSTGVAPETGVYTFEDHDGNGNGTDYPGDLQALKKIAQNYYGGLLNHFSYKGISLDIFFQFVKQTGESYMNSFSNPPGTNYNNQPTFVMRRWQQPGDKSGIQKFSQTFSDAAIAQTYEVFYGDGMITDASFIRLKNVSLSWDIPSIWCERIKMTNAKVFLQGQNLVTFTNYLGLDPETRYSLALPPLRVVTIGAQIKF